MKVLISVLISVFMCILMTGIAFGGKSQEFVEQLSQKIYSDCKGQDIVIKCDSTFNLKKNDQFIKEIIWPYELGDIEVFVTGLTKNEPYASVGPGATIYYGPNATGALRCGTHNLDVNFDNYYWDGEQIEVSRKLETSINVEGDYVQQGSSAIFQKTKGEQSVINVGDKNKISISKSKFSFLENARFTVPISLTLIISVGFNLYFAIKGRKKTKITRSR